MNQAREEFSVSLRKKKKDERIMSKRKARAQNTPEVLWSPEVTLQAIESLSKNVIGDQKPVKESLEQLTLLLQESENCSYLIDRLFKADLELLIEQNLSVFPAQCAQLLLAITQLENLPPDFLFSLSALSFLQKMFSALQFSNFDTLIQISANLAFEGVEHRNNVVKVLLNSEVTSRFTKAEQCLYFLRCISKDFGKESRLDKECLKIIIELLRKFEQESKESQDKLNVLDFIHTILSLSQTSKKLAEKFSKKFFLSLVELTMNIKDDFEVLKICIITIGNLAAYAKEGELKMILENQSFKDFLKEILLQKECLDKEKKMIKEKVFNLFLNFTAAGKETLKVILINYGETIFELFNLFEEQRVSLECQKDILMISQNIGILTDDDTFQAISSVQQESPILGLFISVLKLEITNKEVLQCLLNSLYFFLKRFQEQEQNSQNKQMVCQLLYEQVDIVSEKAVKYEELYERVCDCLLILKNLNSGEIGEAEFII